MTFWCSYFYSCNPYLLQSASKVSHFCGGVQVHIGFTLNLLYHIQHTWREGRATENENGKESDSTRPRLNLRVLTTLVQVFGVVKPCYQEFKGVWPDHFWIHPSKWEFLVSDESSYFFHYPRYNANFAV